MTNTNADPDYYLPSSYSLPKLYSHRQNPRKKGSKIEPSLASSSVTSINRGNASSSGVSKPKKYYSKKIDPSAPKITMPCSECGKKFWSWKALFGHMRCHPERQWRGINPPPHYRKPISPIQEFTAEDHQVASCLILLANNGANVSKNSQCGFECSRCNKVFESHQALNDHRASNHNNVKACFANTSSDEVLGHKCSICMRVFSSGQALGGHKRCHWEKGEEASSSSSPLINNQGLNASPSFTGLDLNLPAPIEDEHQSSTSYSSAFTSPPSLALDLTLGL